MPTNDKGSKVDLQGLLDSPLSPETNLPEPTKPAVDSTGEQDGGTPSDNVDLSGLMTSNPDRAPFRPAMGAGPIDTSLQPGEFKRLNQLRVGEDHYERRAKAQTWWDLMKGSAVQSMAVAVGGTIENTGYLMDLFNPEFYKTLADSQREFQNNYMSEFGRRMQQYARDKAPVYMTRNAQEGFAPGDATWYAGHIPSIFSSIGLIVPAGGVGAAAGRAARALKMTRAAQGGARTLSASLASRHMYSSLESAELYERRYQALLDRGYEDEVARESAANAAGFNYIAGYMNLYKDLVAWSIAFKGINYASRALSQRASSFAKNAPKGSRVGRLLKDSSRDMPKWLGASKDFLKVGAAEALEEINIQYQKKIADRWADEVIGMAPSEREDGVSYFLGTLGDGSVGEHLKDRHTWDAGFWGFMGGMVFGGLSPKVMSATSSSERANAEQQIRDIETQLHGVNNAMDAYASAVENGDSGMAEIILSDTLGKVNLSAVRDGTLDINKEIYQSIIDADESQIQEMGFGEGAKESAKIALDHANAIEKSFNRYMNMELGENTPQVALQAAHLESDATMAQSIADKFEGLFEQEFNDTGLYKSLSDHGKHRARLRNQEIALIHAIDSQETVLDGMEASEPKSPMERIRREAQREHLEELKEELKDVRGRRQDADNRSKTELSKSKHSRETNLVNLTPKTKGAVLPLFRSYDARSFAQIRQTELSHVLDPENLDAINDFVRKQRQKQEKKAEQQAKKEQEETERSEKRKESKEQKQRSERQQFIDDNLTQLEELGYDPTDLNDFSLADLQRAIDDKIRPEDARRAKEFDQAPDRESAGQKWDEDIQLDESAADILLGRRQPKPEQQPEQTETADPVDEAAEDQTPTEEATPDKLDHELHPSDINPIPQAAIQDGTWPLKITHTEQMERPDSEVILIDNRPYTVVPDGEIYDARDRAIDGALREYVLDRMRNEYPELVPNAPGADLAGKRVNLNLSDGSRRLIVDEHGGVFDAISGIRIDNPKVVNMALVRAENNPARRVKYNNMDVVVLSDDRIISVSETNAGEELFDPDSGLSSQQQTMREEIIDRANPQETAIEETQTEEHDQSAQHGVETESDTTTNTELLTEFPEDTDFDAYSVNPAQRLYWRSSRHPGGKPGNDPATAFFEDPDAQVLGRDVEFKLSTDDVAYENLPEDVAEAYRKGTPIEREGRSYFIQTSKRRYKLGKGDFPPIKAHVINPDGTPVKAAGEEVVAFLPQPYTLSRSRKLKKNPETLRKAIDQVLRRRAEFYNAQLQGTPMKSTIMSRSSGFPISQRTEDGAPARNNVEEFIKETGSNVRFGLINRHNTPLDSEGEFMMEIDGRAGHFIMFIQGFEGKWYPHKLNVRKINRREANFAGSLIRGYLKGETRLSDVITEEMSQTVNGLTVGEFFNLLMFHGQDATNIYTKHPNDYRRPRTMYFDSSGGTRSLYLGDKRYTPENIDQEIKNVIKHIYAHKNRQIDRNGFGNGDRLSNVIGRTEPFTWFGRKIDPSKEGSYRDFIFNGEQPAVTTEIQAADPPLIQPSIHFGELDTAEETAPQQTVTITHRGNELEYTVSMEAGEGIIRNSKGERINATSPIGAQVLSQIDWDAPGFSQEDVAETQQETERLDDKYEEDMDGIDPIDPIRHKAEPIGARGKKDFSRSIRGEIEEIESILPPGVDVNIDPEMPFMTKLAHHENPAQVWGMFANGMIYLSENAPEGTAYHEAFHAVFNLSLLESSRREIYKEAEGRFRERNNREADNDLELEEFLADEFAVFMQRDGNHSVGEKTDGFFRRIWEWIKNVFSSPSKIDQLFSKIESGYFAQAPRYDSSVAQGLSPRFKAESEAFTPQIRDAMVRSLAYNVAHRANFQSSEDLSNIDLTEVPGLIKGYYLREKGVNAKRAELWGQAIQPDTLRKIQQDVEDFFYQLGIQAKNYKSFDYDMLVGKEYDDRAIDDQRDTKERLYIPTAYEYSNWDKSSANVRLMVSLLPKVQRGVRNEDGSYQYEYNEITGDPVFVDGERVWNLLLEHLSDTVRTSEASGWQHLIRKLRDAAEIEPSLELLVDRLESDDMQQNKKDEFFNVFGNMAKMNYRTMIAGRRSGGDPAMPSPFQVAIFESDLYRQGRKTMAQWQSTFRGKFFKADGEQMVLDRNALSAHIKEYIKLKTQIKTGFNRGEHLPKLVQLLKDTGIEMDRETFETFLDHQDSEEGAISFLTSRLDQIFTEKKLPSFASMVKASDGENLFSEHNPFSGRAIRRFAQMFNRQHPELSQATILAADSKSKWIYSESNHYFDRLNRMKNDPQFLQELRTGRMTNNLTLLDMIADPNSDPVYSVVANVKSRRKGDQGRDYVDSVKYEKYVLKYNALLRGMAPSMNFSDKKTSMMLTGLNFDPYSALVKWNSDVEGSPASKALADVQFTDEILDQFAGYMESEIQRVYQVQQDQNILAPDDLYENYHFVEEDGEMNFEAAQGRQFVLFPQLSKPYLQDAAPELSKLMYGETNLVSPYDPAMKPLLREQARQFLNSALEQEFKQLRYNRLLGERGQFMSPMIDSKWMSDTYSNKVSSEQKKILDAFSREHSAVATAAVNGLAMNIEQQILFHGDPAAFKNFDDVRKRASGPVAFKRRLNTAAPGVRPYYRMAVARDIIKQSDYMDVLKKELAKVLNPTRLKKVLDPYKAVNTTDAQALITVDRAVEILRGEGRWYPSDDEVLQRWKDGETEVLKTRGGRRIQKLFMTPYKGVHYGIENPNPDGNIEVPVYLKYSQLVLLPGMTERSPQLKAVAEAMERDGIDELVFESGVKAGRRAKRDVSDFSNIRLTQNLLSNENWGRQVETPTKGVTGKGLDATQVRRNILLGIREGRTYPGDRSAAEIQHQYNSAVRELTLRGLSQLEGALGVQMAPKTGIGRINNMQRFVSLMSDQAKQRNASKNVMESYTIKDGNMKVDVELNPQSNQAEAIFMSLFKNWAIRPDVFAGSFVQASSYGFKSYGEMTPQQLADTDLAIPEGELRPPLLENGEVQSAQVLAPSWFGEVISEATGKESSQLTREEIREFFSDNPELLQFIGYRIPNQGLSSIENLEIVGFLPEDMGDTMVVYEELTTKNDSDFDVDKMFGLMPQFKIENGKPVLYEFYDNTSSKKALRAIYNDRYGRQGQLKNLLEILDRIREQREQGIPSDDILREESSVERKDGEWIVGGRPEHILDNLRDRLQEVPSLDDFMSDSMGADPYKVNSDQGLWNHRIRLMIDVMSSPETMAESLMPITDPDLVQFATLLAQDIGTNMSFNGAQEFLPSSQIEIGDQFHKGQAMIGILANHFGSHAISTKTDMAIRKSEVAAGFAAETQRVKGKLVSSLSVYEDYKGRPITEQLSTLMSGFLDATSDSWALKLNLTDDTANIAATILRLGAGWERMLWFLNQPSIRELALLKPLVRNRIVKVAAPSPEVHMIREYRRRLRKVLGHDDLAKALEAGQIEDKSVKQLLKPATLSRHINPGNDPQYLYDQMKMVEAFAELDQVSASLANFVSSTKFDVDMPASLAEMSVNQLRLQEADESGWLNTGGYIESSFLNAFRHVYKTANSVASGIWIGRSKLGRSVLESTLGHLGQSFKASRDKNTIRDVHNGLMMHAIQSNPKNLSVENPIYRSPAEIRQMFYGNTTMARRLINMKAKPELADNTLVNFLNPSIEPGRPDFIEASYRERGTLFTDRLIHGWEELLASTDPEVRAFGKDLVPYAYTTSGGRRGMNTIHDLIPSEELTELTQYFRQFKAIHGNDTAATGAVVRDIFRNEYQNELLVPRLYQQDVSRKAYKDKMLKGFDVPIQNLPVKEVGEEIVFPEVVRLGDQIYKAVTDVTSDDRVAYALLQKKGYHDGNFHIYEYFNPDDSSIVRDNEVPDSVPFDESPYHSRSAQSDLFRIVEDKGEAHREFTMDKVLKNKLC